MVVLTTQDVTIKTLVQPKGLCLEPEDRYLSSDSTARAPARSRSGFLRRAARRRRHTGADGVSVEEEWSSSVPQDPDVDWGRYERRPESFESSLTADPADHTSVSSSLTSPMAPGSFHLWTCGRTVKTSAFRSRHSEMTWINGVDGVNARKRPLIRSYQCELDVSPRCQLDSAQRGTLPVPRRAQCTNCAGNTPTVWPDRTR